MTDFSPQPGADMPDPVQPAPRSGRGLRWALVISLGLNLAVAGVLAGAMLRHQGMGPRGDLVRDLHFGRFTDAMEPGQRAALRAEFIARAPEMRQARRQMRLEMAEVLAALRAEPFAPARFAALMDKHGQRMASRMALGQTLMSEFVAGLDPAARADFAARLEQRIGGKAGAPSKGTPEP